ncbi:ABC transporter permease [Roseivirga sp. E12]|uniref:ABC transporter permease n=1 Tax=Roseivirga sp. E12 TaxID=2819237 RepID=UPI001ABC1F41|nr:ABC transporter permease [Roseivirga sp. E12]
MENNKPIAPPKFAEWLVKLFCRKDYAEEVLGDVHEVYCWRIEEKGKTVANLRYFLDAFSAIRLLKIENKTTVKLNFLAMISLKVTLRTFMCNKSQTVTNLFGLACGFMVFLAIFQYVSFEKNYDAFIPDNENLFRVNSTLKRDSLLVFETAEAVPAIGRNAYELLPQVADYFKLFNSGSENNCVISLDEQGRNSFNESGIMHATAHAPSLLGLRMIEGDAEFVLDEPFEVIISKSLQLKYFQGASAVGKTITFDDDDENHEVLTVSGVFEDFPGDSHLAFDMLVSFKTLYTRETKRGETAKYRYDEDWEGAHDFLTYLKLSPGTPHEPIATVLEENMNAPITYPGYAYQLNLKPVKAIHTSAAVREEVKTVADVQKLNTLLILGVFVLVLAWVNFINLTTATALGRAKETGMRKVLGGTRKQLIWQFLFESVLTGFIAFAVGILFFSLSFNYFNEFLPVTEKWYLFNEFHTTLLILGIVFVCGLVAGIYPAFVLSGFKPVTVLKGVFKNSGNGLLVRKVLVVLQAGISIFLITGLLAIVKQVDYMLNNDLGMEPEQVLVIAKPGNLNKITDEDRDHKSLFKSLLSSKSFVKDYAVTDALPGSVLRKGKDINLTEVEDNEVKSRAIFVEYDYFKLLDIPFVAGRDFRNTVVDEKSVVLNESAVKALGFSDPQEVVDQRLYEGDEWVNIIGVISDYHHTSLKNQVVPMIIGTRSWGLDYHLIKIDGGSIEKSLAEVEEAFNTVFPGNPFDYYFLDEHFEQNYAEEQQFGRSFGFFALIAILIASIGLYSLSSFITISRSKEIGIRKVLGARSSSIVNHLNKDFLILILLAAFVATPLSLWAVEGWLDSFPYRIGLGLMFFVVPGLVILMVSLTSVSFKTVVASRVNPINLLQRE